MRRRPVLGVGAVTAAIALVLVLSL
ncbi:MAG: hypothetical protein QOI37_1759, partial [Chloroflexota bacterium]|nr:hypothetical protein [Chloroflexota bacterium]